MFNTTNIHCNNAGPHGTKVDVWTKVTAVCTVVMTLLTALLLMLTISASHPTIVVRPVAVPTPALLQPRRRANHHVVLNATHSLSRQREYASESPGYPSPAWTPDTSYSR
jgi:hypothetical protein